MSDSELFSTIITRSVNHIFENFLSDKMIEEVYETQSSSDGHSVAVEIDGTIRGELIINLPKKTLNSISKKLLNNGKSRLTKKQCQDIAGELVNLISGTFVNQLQYADYDLELSAPEFNNDPIEIKALYDNVNLSFSSSHGGFDVDLYYRED
jgi:CheY-specific phosphatase CheX